MGKKGKKGKQPSASVPVVASAASADAPVEAEAEEDPVDPAPAKNSSVDSSDEETGTTIEGDEPREQAPTQLQSHAMDDIEATVEREESASASDDLVMELASLRARCVSLEEEAKAASSSHAQALRSLRAEQDALAHSHLAELARVRAAADAHASSAKSELVSMQAMSSAQRAKIDALSQTVSELEETLETFERERDSTRAAAIAEAVALALGTADAKHEAATRAAVASGREALRRAYVVHAAAKSAWAAEKIGLIEARGDAIEREAEEAARIARFARAACRNANSRSGDVSSLNGLTEEEKKEALLSPGAALRALFATTTPSRSRAALAAAEAGRAAAPASGERRTRDTTNGTNDAGSLMTAATSESDGNSSSDSDARRKEEAEKTPGSRGGAGGDTLADLLDDAMEDELSASVARGYCVDAETGELVVGAGAIVEKVMAKYRGDASGASRKNLSPLFSPCNAGAPGAYVHPDVAARVASGQGPALEKATCSANGDASGDFWRAPSGAHVEASASQSEKFALRLERERAHRERAVLLAELQRCRSDLDRARLEAQRSEIRAEAIDATASLHEKEEEACVRRLELASEMRAMALESSLREAREKAVPPSALRAVLAELGEIRARLARVREAQETSARLVIPTVASALACLKLGERRW